MPKAKKRTIKKAKLPVDGQGDQKDDGKATSKEKDKDKDKEKKPKAKSKAKVKGKEKTKIEEPLDLTPSSSSTTGERGSGDGPHQSRSQQSQVALHFLDICLRHSDIQLLLSPLQGINERLVTFYYTYLQQKRHRSETEIHFLPPALTARLGHMDMRELRRMVRDRRLHEKQFVLLPLCTNPRPHGHWSLLLVSRPDGKFYHYDSLENTHIQLATAVAETLRAPLGAWDFVLLAGRCLQQQQTKPEDRKDPHSGIHLLCMTDHVTDYVARCGYASSSLLISWEQVSAMRCNLIQLIRSLGGIIPPTKGY